jgi:hypothetical protein
MRELQISKKDLRETRIADVALPALPDGAVRLKLDLFALTANNITYAAMGEGMLGYWDFFPGPEGWGRVPVWGFADVVQSNAPAIAEGARYYGYYPISEVFDASPAVTQAGFVDSAPHRAAKAAIYNHYVATATDPAYDKNYEPEQTLFRPLYGTGWWAADCIHQAAPRTVIFSSASSKTALATAHQLRAVSGARRIGLTSARNAPYVAETGLYDRVAPYEEAAALRVDGPATFVDFLGRGELTAAVHSGLGATLTRSIIIGATDWADKPGGVAPPSTPLPGPAPEFFFVPTYAAGRLKEDAKLGAAMVRDLRNFYDASRDYVTAQRLRGDGAIQQSWARLAAGEVAPRDGLVLSF